MGIVDSGEPLSTSGRPPVRGLYAQRDGARFEGQIHVAPWPVYDLIDRKMAGVLQRETLGLLWYRVLGRTNALFPWP